MKYIRKNPALFAIIVISVLVICLNAYAALTNTYDTATPGGSDDPDTLTSYSSLTDLGFLYQKDDSGNGELFWQDEAGNVIQITKAGKLFGNTFTGNVAITGAVTAASLELGGSGAVPTEFSIDGTLAGNSDTAIPTEKAVKTYTNAAPKAQAKADNVAGAAFVVGSQSFTAPNGLIIKCGSVTGAQSSDRTVTFTDAFPGGCLNVQITPQSPTAVGHSGNIQILSMVASNFHFVQPNGTAAYNLVYWLAIGY